MFIQLTFVSDVAIIPPDSDGDKMRFSKTFVPVGIVLAVFLVFTGCAAVKPTNALFASTGGDGMVVSVNPIASQIGMEVLRSGGNAVDAAIATGFALGVVNQYNCGLGGGTFIVIRMADGTVHTIDGREMAPSAATRDMYIRDGEFDPSLSQRGPLAAGVPGVPAAYLKALELEGTKPLNDLLVSSIAVARNGFELTEKYISSYEQATEYLRQDPASAAIYFHEDGSQLEAGDIFKQPDLAETYEKLSQLGLDYFYRGEFAQRTAKYMKENGGLISEEDMANYRAVVRAPVVGQYRGYTVIGMPPPSSGGVHVLQMLNMIEASKVLDGETQWSGKTTFRVAQFMERAFQDRAEFLGDMDYYPVPVERLISKDYAASLVDEIMTAAAKVRQPTAEVALEPGHTTNFCVIDRQGNAVAINHTVNLTYGAMVTVPGTGVVLNCEMDDFSARPGVPNFFGLIGSEANAIEPGKRPLSSMSPTIVVKNDRSVMVLGGSGGPRIITGVLQTLIGVLDFNLPLRDAVEMPRFHHQYKPEALFVEPGLSDLHRTVLRERGFELKERDGLGRVRVIVWDKKNQTYRGYADGVGIGPVAY